MSDLTLEHDPDEGCQGCPLQYTDSDDEHWCNADDGGLTADHLSGAVLPVCPLRAGRVVVQRAAAKASVDPDV